MPVSSGVGVQAAQAGAVAATADQTDDVQNAAETSAEDSAQNADSDDLEGPFSIWMVRLRQTILRHSRMEIYRRIRRHSRMEMRHQTRRHRISAERLCKTRTAIMSQSRQVINRTLRLEQILMILKER